ncbi:hypothetical protein [Alistipes ihumii]|uniref:hypothetical protein n=1 Tax=Alistipes ihumii TaxID=1470347 RepID=UPI003AB3887C
MTRKELERKLEKSGRLSRYFLDGSLRSDCGILLRNYSVWEYFHMDERGSRTLLNYLLRQEKPMIIIKMR